LQSSKSKNVAELQKLLAEFKKKTPDDYQRELPGLQIRMAIRFLDEGKIQEAEERLLHVLTLEPENAQAHLVLGYCYGYFFFSNDGTNRR
jgi:Tfp pilus assembly protein PilF